MSDVNTFNAAERRKTDHNTDWTLLTKFTPTKNATYQLGLAQKTRSPNLYERYSWSTNGMVMRMVNLAGDGNGYVGNLELEPEIAHTISFSADWHDQTQSHWGVNVAPYLSYVDDYIDAERCSSTAMMTGCTAANLTTTDDFVYLRYNNVSAKLYGIDVTAHTMLYQDAELGHIHGKATISYVKGENRDTGDNLYNIMPLNATFILEHAQGRWHSQAEWELVSAKDDVNAERNEVETGGYGLLNLRSSYDWGQTRVDFGVSNVFDKFYSQPLAGAYLGEGQTMSAAGVAWGDTVPAMGRSFFTGLTVKF
jgi:iron complex outermembrane receptor protein